MKSTAPIPQMLGSGGAIRSIDRQIATASRFDEPVLVLGETGVGKELVARLVHLRSDRGHRSLQVINCAGVAAELLGSELFGHRVGAFTGAARRRAGRIRAADGSTIVLDEISETPARFQAALLRTIENGEVQPIGSDAACRVDVRFIAISNRSISELGHGDSFRQDLFHRLASLLITVPPLRHRLEDLEELSMHFLSLLADRYGNTKRLNAGALALLAEHGFPGNVRELRQILTRAYAASKTTTIASSNVANAILPTSCPANQAVFNADDNRSLERIIRGHIRRTLALADDNISAAARRLEVPRSTLQHYLLKYQIAPRPRHLKRPRPPGQALPNAGAEPTTETIEGLITGG